jgi:hypothetical protein
VADTVAVVAVVDVVAVCVLSSFFLHAISMIAPQSANASTYLEETIPSSCHISFRMR